MKFTLKGKDSTKLLVLGFALIVMIEAAIFFIFVIQNNTVKRDVASESYEKIVSRYNDYKQINEDYVGQLIFDSGLINTPVVQAKSLVSNTGEYYTFFDEYGSTITNQSGYTGNDVYAWMNFETMRYDYDKNGGSIYMDYHNKLDDQNVLIYGHFFTKKGHKDPGREKAFTPLEDLLKQNAIKEHSTLKFVTNGEIREYKLWAVYKYKTTDPIYLDKCQYYRTNYSFNESNGLIDYDYMTKYIEFVNSIKLYDTGVQLTNKDKTLTLQCVPVPNENEYEVCVFKLTYTGTFKNSESK